MSQASAGALLCRLADARRPRNVTNTEWSFDHYASLHRRAVQWVFIFSTYDNHLTQSCSLMRQVTVRKLPSRLRSSASSCLRSSPSTFHPYAIVYFPHTRVKRRYIDTQILLMRIRNNQYPRGQPGCSGFPSTEEEPLLTFMRNVLAGKCEL